MNVIKPTLKILLLVYGLSLVIFLVLLFSICGPKVYSTNVLLIVVAVFSMISPFVVLIFYLTHTYRNSNLTKEQKHTWAALLFFGHIIVFPFYWYQYIWSDKNGNKV
jgi:hypothetical protein